MPANEHRPVLPSSKYEAQLKEWRKRCFTHMGFGDFQANALALANVDHHKVQQMLNAGCSKELACHIML